MLYPVILAGGSGTRLWPLSRRRHPKQLLPLVGDPTMLQETVARLRGVPDLAPPVVVCNDVCRFMIAEQLRLMGAAPRALILEPAGRNTMPAAAAAAMKVMEDHDREDVPLLLVLPADHHIRRIDEFHRTLAIAVEAARAGRLVTFGIQPDAPETGYGYIRTGDPAFPGEGGAPVSEIREFVEKPDLETARSYLASGEYLWNSGMFLFRADVMLAELARLNPEMHAACAAAVAAGKTDLDFFRLDEDAFAACPSDSIDYAIMEKTDRGAVVPFDGGWNDVGSWEALWQVGDKDGDGNVAAGDVLLYDVKDSYLRAESRLVAAVGLENHILVETADAVLISPRDRVQDVKALVEKLKADDRPETRAHKTVFSRWGASERLVSAERFRVNRLVIKPGAGISLQKHYNRAEHWIVVSGTALISKDGEDRILTEGASIYFSPGNPHRLKNPGKIPLEIIEVQTGGYLGEDDIERL